MPERYELSSTDKVKISTEAAEAFVDSYYTALNSARHTIASYYVPPNNVSGRLMPYISYNGELIQDGKQLQDRYEDKSLPYMHFECQSLDAHVLNPCLDGVPAATRRDAERNMSLIVQVSGSVRLMERKDGPLRGISESFVLVPNKEEVGAKGTGKGDYGRKWLIQTQNFRIVV
jgi:NTF2-related export protein 1/2